MKNFKISKTKVQLSDEQVEKLYKEYGKIDSKQKKFKGTHREYVEKVGGMINHWLVSNNFKSDRKLKGSGLTEDLASELATKEAAYETSPSEDKLKDINKIRKKIALEQEVSNFYPIKAEVFNPANKRISGVRPYKVDKEYKEIAKEREEKLGIENPFLSNEPGFTTYAGTTPEEMYKNMIDQLYEFEDIFRSFVDDETAQKNMLILLPFDQILALTPEGISQRELFCEHLESIGRSITTDLGVGEWDNGVEASYRSELFVFDKYIAPALTKEEIKIERFKILGKLLSLKQREMRVDFIFPFFTGDSKGKLTAGKIGDRVGPDAQVNFDKILNILFESLNRGIEKAEVLFNVYKSYRTLNKFDASVSEPGRYGVNKVPFEVLLKLDINKILKSKFNVLKNKEGNSLADEIEAQYLVWSGLSPAEKQEYFSKVNAPSVTPNIRQACWNYLFEEHIERHIAEYSRKNPRKPPITFLKATNDWFTSTKELLSITLSEEDVDETETDKQKEKIRSMNESINKLEVVGFSGTLFPTHFASGEFPTAKEYGNLYKTEEGLDILRSFTGDTWNDYKFKVVAPIKTDPVEIGITDDRVTPEAEAEAIALPVVDGDEPSEAASGVVTTSDTTLGQRLPSRAPPKLPITRKELIKQIKEKREKLEEEKYAERIEKIEQIKKNFTPVYFQSGTRKGTETPASLTKRADINKTLKDLVDAKESLESSLQNLTLQLSPEPDISAAVGSDTTTSTSDTPPGPPRKVAEGKPSKKYIKKVVKYYR